MAAGKKLEKLIAELQAGLPEAQRGAALLLMEGMKGRQWGDVTRAKELMQMFLAGAVQCLRYMPYSEEETGRLLHLGLGLAFFHDTSDEERAEIAARLAREGGR